MFSNKPLQLHNRGHRREKLVMRCDATYLGEDEVKVALQSMSKAGGILVAILLEHVNQVLCHVTQLVHWACNVLNQHASTCNSSQKTITEIALAHITDMNISGNGTGGVS